MTMTKQTIVVKVGTNILTTPEGRLDLNNLRQLVDQFIWIKETTPHNLVIVTSGAITCGSEQLDIIPQTVPEKQASAAIGQLILLKEYSHFFEKKGFKIGQILVTKQGMTNEESKTNIINTLRHLLNHNVIPIINENDSVSIEELSFGDNDLLSGILASLIQADTLILLTDQNGVYDKNPKEDNSAQLIKTFDTISDSLIDTMPGSTNPRSKGGIKSKLMAAKLASEKGCNVFIGNGRTPNILKDYINHNFPGTIIASSDK